jgi:hypothetical protein
MSDSTRWRHAFRHGSGCWVHHMTFAEIISVSRPFILILKHFSGSGMNCANWNAPN